MAGINAAADIVSFTISSSYSEIGKCKQRVLCFLARANTSLGSQFETEHELSYRKDAKFGASHRGLFF